jgi:cadmium resistance protein CadD (predicted permease)
MKINEAGWDRTLRIVIGLVAISLVFIGSKTMWGLLGIIPLATGVTGSCLLYSVMGVSTCPVQK